MFKTETPSVMEDNIYDYSAPSKNTNNQDISPAKSNGFKTSSSSSSSSSSSFSSSSSAPTSSQPKNHIRNHSRSESVDDGELSVNMINPVVSPLQGTKIVMELSRVLPHGATIKIGGKQVNIFPSDDNPNEISFISPPLSSGSKLIQITLPSGKTTNLDGLLIYEELMPQTQFYSNSHVDSHQQPATVSSSAPQSSGRVWGKRG